MHKKIVTIIALLLVLAGIAVTIHSMLASSPTQDRAGDKGIINNINTK
jgi:hypothetical protein